MTRRVASRKNLSFRPAKTAVRPESLFSSRAAGRCSEFFGCDDEAEVSGAAPQSHVECDQPASQDFGECDVLGVVGFGPAELDGERQCSSRERRIAAVQSGCGVPSSNVSQLSGIQTLSSSSEVSSSGSGSSDSSSLSEGASAGRLSSTRIDPDVDSAARRAAAACSSVQSGACSSTFSLAVIGGILAPATRFEKPIGRRPGGRALDPHPAHSREAGDHRGTLPAEGLNHSPVPTQAKNRLPPPTVGVLARSFSHNKSL